MHAKNIFTKDKAHTKEKWSPERSEAPLISRSRRRAHASNSPIRQSVPPSADRDFRHKSNSCYLDQSALLKSVGCVTYVNV